MRPESSVRVSREHPRHSSRIPVDVEIAHAWEAGSQRAVSGTLYNVSRGGAAVAVAWAFPPRTRLRILVPVTTRLRLLAEVVWTSLVPGRDPRTAIYGVRWIDHLSREHLEAMAPDRKGSGPGGETQGPRA
jgi:hypothetical protein